MTTTYIYELILSHSRNKFVKSIQKGKMTVFSAMITGWYVVTPKLFGLPIKVRSVSRAKHFIRACIIPMIFQNIRLIDPSMYCKYANNVRRQCLTHVSTGAHSAASGIRYTGSSLMNGILADLDATQMYTGSSVDVEDQVEAAAAVEDWMNFFQVRMLRDLLLILSVSA